MHRVKQAVDTMDGSKIRHSPNLDRYLQTISGMKYFLIALLLFSLAFPRNAQSQIKLDIHERERDTNREIGDALNYSDCVHDYSWEFIYTYSGTGAGYMYWYLGENCDDLNSRKDPPQHPSTQGGTYKWTSKQLFFAASGLADCAPLEDTLTIWLLVMSSPSDETPMSSSFLQISIDTKGPDPASGVTAKFAQKGAMIDWSVNENSNVEDNAGFYILCWPRPKSIPPDTLEPSSSDAGTGTSGDGGTKSRSLNPRAFQGRADAGSKDGGLDGSIADAGGDAGGDAGYDAGDGSADADADTDADTDADGDSDLGSNGCGAAGGFGEGDTIILEDYRCTGRLGSSTRSHTVRGLENGVEYRFGVVVVDKNDNASDVSDVACATPEDVLSFFDIYREAGGKGSGFCFIATAAYGSYDHPHVKLLREFRDRYLQKMPGGPSLIRAYYEVGPMLARGVAGHEGLRLAARILLLPLVGLAALLLVLGPLGSLLLLAGGGAAGAYAFYAAKRRRMRFGP